MLSVPSTRKARGAKFDMQAILLMALRNITGSSNASAAPEPDELDRQPLEKWKKIAAQTAENSLLSPKALELIVSVFRIEPSRDSISRKVQALFGEGKYEEGSAV